MKRKEERAEIENAKKEFENDQKIKEEILSKIAS
jgi:hypothetical protein